MYEIGGVGMQILDFDMKMAKEYAHHLPKVRNKDEKHFCFYDLISIILLYLSQYIPNSHLCLLTNKHIPTIIFKLIYNFHPILLFIHKNDKLALLKRKMMYKYIMDE